MIALADAQDPVARLLAATTWPDAVVVLVIALAILGCFFISRRWPAKPFWSSWPPRSEDE